MISDYVGSMPPLEADKNGMTPTYDVWGKVLAASDNTAKGSVRVRVNAMKDGMDTFDNVPVLSVYGGHGYGAYAMPEEGDIVRLTFLCGDFRHPVVTGCRFPAESQFVKDMHQEKNQNKGWKTKSGSSVVFSGEKGKEKIKVADSGKMDWELDEEKEQISFGDTEKKNRISVEKKNGKASITSEKEICLECGKSKLELKKDGTITISCETLTIEAKNVRIKGKTKLQLEGQELQLKASTGLTVSSSAQMKIDSKGQMKLSGAMINLN